MLAITCSLILPITMAASRGSGIIVFHSSEYTFWTTFIVRFVSIDTTKTPDFNLKLFIFFEICRISFICVVDLFALLFGMASKSSIYLIDFQLDMFFLSASIYSKRNSNKLYHLKRVNVLTWREIEKKKTYHKVMITIFFNKNLFANGFVLLNEEENIENRRIIF